MQSGWRKKYVRYKSFLLDSAGTYKRRTDIRVYLEIILSLVTISLFSVFALRPTLLTIAELIKEIEAKKDVVGSLDIKIQNITSAQILYNQNRENIQLLKTSIPDSADTEMLIHQLEGLIEKSGTNVEDITIDSVVLLGEEAQTQDKTGEPTEPEVTKNLSFSITVNGEYPALFNFVSDAENLLRPLIIKSVNITVKVDEETEEKTISLVLTADMPYKTDL